MLTPNDVKTRVENILALCNKANELFARYGTAEQKAADNAFYTALMELDTEAKLTGRGAQPGRLVKFGVADGYARYIILRVNKKTCKVVHIPYGDGYRSSAVDGDEVWRDEVEDNLAWHDTIAEMADKAKRVPVLPVVAAED